MTNDWTGTKFVKDSPYGSTSNLVQRSRKARAAATKQHHSRGHLVRHGPNDENFL